MTKQNKALPNFLIIPSVLIRDKNKKIRTLDGYVYGVVYWYSQLALKECVASSRTIAEILGSSEGAVQNSINRLVAQNYVESIYNREKHKRELIPLITFTKAKSTTPSDVVAPHPQNGSTTSADVSTRAHLGTPNKNTKEEDKNDIPPRPPGGVDSPPSSPSNGEHKKETGVPPSDDAAANRLAVQEIFDHYMKKSGSNKNTKLFESRRRKIKKRMEAFAVDQIKTAITNCFNDSFFSGDNDRKWKANLEYIMRNDQNIEKLLYLKPRQRDGGVGYEQ